MTLGEFFVRGTIKEMYWLKSSSKRIIKQHSWENSLQLKQQMNGPGEIFCKRNTPETVWGESSARVTIRPDCSVEAGSPAKN